MEKTKPKSKTRGEELLGEGYEPIDSSSEIYVWNEEGQEIEGVFIEKRKTDLGFLLDIETPDGVVAVSCPTMLARLTSPVLRGDKIYIMYMGTQPSKIPGRAFKVFTVLRKRTQEIF